MGYYWSHRYKNVISWTTDVNKYVMDKFLEKHNLLKLTQEEIGNLNKL